jgi:hypothetical protein
MAYLGMRNYDSGLMALTSSNFAVSASRRNRVITDMLDPLDNCWSPRNDYKYI